MPKIIECDHSPEKWLLDTENNYICSCGEYAPTTDSKSLSDRLVDNELSFKEATKLFLEEE